MDIKKLAMVLQNDADSAALSAVPAESATLTVDNLKRSQRSYVFRSTSTADQVILGEWSIGTYLSAFCLSRHNIKGTVRLRLYDAAGQSGNVVYDSGDIPAQEIEPWGSFAWGTQEWGYIYDDGLPKNFILFFETVPCVSFQIDIVDPTNADGYFEIGRLFLGIAEQTEFNLSYGGKLAWVESTKQTRTDGGTLHSEPALPFRRFDFNLDWMNEADRENLSKKIKATGKRKDIFISVYPDSSDAKFNEYSFIAKFTKTPEFTRNFLNNYTSGFQVEEC